MLDFRSLIFLQARRNDECTERCPIHTQLVHSPWKRTSGTALSGSLQAPGSSPFFANWIFACQNMSQANSRSESRIVEQGFYEGENAQQKQIVGAYYFKFRGCQNTTSQSLLLVWKILTFGFSHPKSMWMNTVGQQQSVIKGLQTGHRSTCSSTRSVQEWTVR